MRKIYILLTIILLNVSLFAQDDCNRTDNLGRRQGKWIDYYDNGQIRCVGKFKDNEPIDEFLFYSDKGILIAKGEYLNKKKHNQWEYYSENDGSVILRENYNNGILEGKTIVYSAVTHKIVEETEYVDGIRNGECNQYYDNGKLMIKMNYKNDKLDGLYVSYYPNGAKKDEGNYKDGNKIGEWKTYDTEENVISIDIYGL